MAIDILNVDLLQFVKEVYALSHPQGMGHFHFQLGPLADEEAKAIINSREGNGIAVSMDYVRGRACKMTVWRAADGTLSIRDEWYDHTATDLAELLRRCGIWVEA